MFNAFPSLKCSQKCKHNVQTPDSGMYFPALKSTVPVIYGVNSGCVFRIFLQDEVIKEDRTRAFIKVRL